MQDITPQKAIELSSKIGKDGFSFNPFYLVSYCKLEERNGEELIFETEVPQGTEAVLLFPQKEENRHGCAVGTAYDEDVQAIMDSGYTITEKEQIATEYIFRTKDFIELEGSQWKRFRKEINYFEKSHKYSLLADYPLNKVESLVRTWANQKRDERKEQMTSETTKIFEDEIASTLKALELLSVIPHKKIFVEVDGKLAGFSIMVPLSRTMWIGLIQKTDYQYRGLSRFFYPLICKEMIDVEYFSLGADALDSGLATFKESLNPVKKRAIYLVKVL